MFQPISCNTLIGIFLLEWYYFTASSAAFAENSFLYASIYLKDLHANFLTVERETDSKAKGTVVSKPFQV